MLHFNAKRSASPLSFTPIPRRVSAEQPRTVQMFFSVFSDTPVQPNEKELLIPNRLLVRHTDLFIHFLRFSVIYTFLC